MTFLLMATTRETQPTTWRGSAAETAAAKSGNRPDAAATIPFGGWATVGAAVLLLVIVSLVFRTFDLDRVICRELATGSGWDALGQQPWKMIYRWGPLPGLLLGIGGGIAALVARFGYGDKERARAGLYLLITLALGPGLLINAVLKPLCKRPRPVSLQEFGGDQQFVAVGSLGDVAGNHSFPSGHASMGFLLMAPAFLLYRQRPGWAVAVLVGGVAMGLLIGWGRMVQGGHFATDVVWSAGIVYLSMVASYQLTGLHREQPAPTSADLDESAIILKLEPAARESQDDRSQRAA